MKTGAGLLSASRYESALYGRPVLRGLSGALGLLRVERFFTADVDLDLLWLGFGLLGQLHLQNALVVVRRHGFGVYRVRQREGSGEGTISPLNATVVLFLLFLLKFALAVDGQGVVLDANIDVVFVNSAGLRSSA
jgi:hypothetical protein